MLDINQIYTDLASEARDIVCDGKDIEIPGVKVKIEKNNEKDITITNVFISSDEGANALKKAKGKYITIECNLMKEGDLKKHREIAKILSRELKVLMNSKNNKKTSTLIVGLGNNNVTADSLGPRTIDNIIVTRHILKNEIDTPYEKIFGNVCAIVPGVMGKTGIETSDMIKSVASDLKVDNIVVIDALAARSVNKINTTIQLTDTGIYPGSGVGNKRQSITKESMGIPVIAIGVPTVVNALTLLCDMVPLSSQDMVKKQNEYSNLCVTPKEEDVVIERIKNIITNGINLTIHNGISLEEINEFTY